MNSLLKNESMGTLQFMKGPSTSKSFGHECPHLE
jgi:hypothetical protein